MRAVATLLFAVGIGIVILLASLGFTWLVPTSLPGGVPRSLITHTVQWGLSVLAILLARRPFRKFGFTRGGFCFSPRILWWVLPTAILATLATLGPGRTGGGRGFGDDMGVVRTILVVWIYASLAEEIFIRGLVQTVLDPLRDRRLRIGRTLHLSVPVMISGIFFGCSHLVAIRIFGPAMVMIILITTVYGIAAAYHREQSGSLIPAIIIHVLANVGGSLPVWVIGALAE